MGLEKGPTSSVSSEKGKGVRLMKFGGNGESPLQEMLASETSLSSEDVKGLELIRESVSDLFCELFDALDGSEDILEVAPQKAKDGELRMLLGPLFNLVTIGLPGEDDWDLQGDLCGDWPVLGESFDVVVCTEVIEHVDNPFLAADNLFETIRPGGTLLLTTPLNFRIHGPFPDNWRFTEMGLRQLLKKFSKVEITSTGNDRHMFPLHYQVRATK